LDERGKKDHSSLQTIVLDHMLDFNVYAFKDYIRHRLLHSVHNETLAKFELVMNKLDLKPKEAILDAGAGLNVFCFEMARRGGTVVAIDVNSSKMIMIKHIARKMRFRMLDICVASVTNIPFRNDSFNKVLCSEVLEHVPDDKSVIDEFYRIIKRGGKVVITTPLLKSKKVFKAISKYPEDHVRSGYTVSEIQKLLHNSRFQNINIELYCGALLNFLAEIEFKLARIIFGNLENNMFFSLNYSSVPHGLDWLLVVKIFIIKLLLPFDNFTGSFSQICVTGIK